MCPIAPTLRAGLTCSSSGYCCVLIVAEAGKIWRIAAMNSPSFKNVIFITANSGLEADADT